MRIVLPRAKQDPWFQEAPWLVLAIGASLALVLVTIATFFLIRPTFNELVTLVGALAVTSVLSLAAGFILYRRGWAKFPSISLTLVLTYAWAAVLTLFNVWVMARLMFVNTHDLTLAGILLVFSAIIATAFGISVTAGVTDSLRQLANASNRLAGGDLNARAEVHGRNEIAQVAKAFNGMAEKIQQTEIEREELEKLRRDLIAWTSHDLRTPLTSIRVMIEALNDGVVTDETTKKRYYQSMLAEVVFLKNLIDDLFELAQLDAGGVVLDIENHSLSDLISDTFENLQPLAERKSISLTMQVGPDLDPVPMNAPGINRVLANLLDNSIKHTAPGGNIWLKAERRPGGAEVVIEDDGPGFSTEELPRVFEKFYRGEQARSRAKGGAGLGLSIAAGIVSAHGGRIWAKNREGGGALVGFLLPAP